MVRIEISPNDKEDLLKLLDILQEELECGRMKKNKYIYESQWNWSKYGQLRIDQLRQSIQGKGQDSIISSSLNTFERSMNDKEKNKYRYQKSKGGDIIDIFNYEER